MRFHCEDNYYFPNLVGVESGRIDQYCFLENEMMLRLILQQVNDGMLDLFFQYPNIFEEEIILKLMDRAYQGAQKLKLDPVCCYHYSGKDHGISKGVSLFSTVEDVDVFLGKMIINFGKRRQTKVDFLYDLDNDCMMPKQIVEVELKDGKAIQQSFSPKMLSKVKKYIEY